MPSTKRLPVAPRSISPSRWAAMSNRAKSAAIARDAVWRAKAGQLRPETGNWLYIRSDRRCEEVGGGWNPIEITDLQQLMRKQVPCEACALGGALCSLAFHEDKLTYRTAVDGPTSRLMQVLGRENMIAIELAFEQGMGGYGESDLADSELAERAVRFGSRYRNERNRFIAIWSNVAANRGVFTP